MLKKKLLLTTLFLLGFATTNFTNAATVDELNIQVLERHMEAVITGNTALLLADYAADAVVITPFAVFNGTEELKAFGDFVSQMGDSVKDMEVEFETQGEEAILVHYTTGRGTPQEYSGTDVFVVRNGKIIIQVPQPEFPPGVTLD